MEIKMPDTFVPKFHNTEAVKKMRYNMLGKTGIKVSHLSLGAAQLAYCIEKNQIEESTETICHAVKMGINYIDTAPYYGEGRSETVLGKALKHIPRESYYIATKVGRYTRDFSKMFDFSSKRTTSSVTESLEKLGCGHIDVIQVHDVEFAESPRIIVEETLPALQKLKESGLVKFIGITGYNVEKLKEIVELSTVKIDTVLSYSRCTLFNQDLKQYIPYFQERNIGLINAACLGMALLTKNGPPDWHPVHDSLKSACASAAKFCEENGTDIAKLANYYSFTQSGICTNLIGMSFKRVLEENLDVLLNGLSEKELQLVEKVQERFFQPLSQTHWENIEVRKYWEHLSTVRKHV